MDTYLWGELLWRFLWEVVRAYHQSKCDKRDLYMIFYSLRYVIPCKICRAHYAEHLQVLPPSSTSDFVQWVYILKNRVSSSQGRSITVITLEQFRLRLAITRELLPASDFWNLWIILALNYPGQNQESVDPQTIYKKHSYAVFYYYTSKVFSGIPHLANLFKVRGILKKTNGAPLEITLESISTPSRSIVTSMDLLAQNIPGTYGDSPYGTIPQSVVVPPKCSGKYAWDDYEDLLRWTRKQKRKWERVHFCGSSSLFDEAAHYETDFIHAVRVATNHGEN
jgi:hypothetical protein